MELLREAAGEGRAVLVTLHDLGLAAAGCDRLRGIGAPGRVSQSEDAETSGRSQQ